MKERREEEKGNQALELSRTKRRRGETKVVLEQEHRTIDGGIYTLSQQWRRLAGTRKWITFALMASGDANGDDFGRCPCRLMSLALSFQLVLLSNPTGQVGKREDTCEHSVWDGGEGSGLRIGSGSPGHRAIPSRLFVNARRWRQVCGRNGEHRACGKGSCRSAASRQCIIDSSVITREEQDFGLGFITKHFHRTCLLEML